MFDWSKPFDPSMLDGDVLIAVPSDGLAKILAQILDERGIVWGGGDKIPGHEMWGDYRTNTMWKYYHETQEIKRGSILHTDQYHQNEFLPRCTFYGVPLGDIDIPDDIELF